MFPYNSETIRLTRGVKENSHRHERSSLPRKKFICISMGMLQIGALLLVGRLVEAPP